MRCAESNFSHTTNSFRVRSSVTCAYQLTTHVNHMTVQYVQLAHTCRLAAVRSLHEHIHAQSPYVTSIVGGFGGWVCWLNYKRKSERSFQCMRCCVLCDSIHINIDGATSHCLWLRQNCSVSTSMLCSSFSLSSTRLGTQATRNR